MSNTGRKIYRFLKQISVADDLPTGVYKPNYESDPDHIPPVIDYDACPVDSWVPISPSCQLQKTCPPGYAYNATLDVCERIIQTPAERNYDYSFEYDPIIQTGSGAWGRGGSFIMHPGFALNGQGTFSHHLTTPKLWLNGDTLYDGASNAIDGPLNRSAITIAEPDYELNKWYSVFKQINLTMTKTYYLGISADNKFRVSIDGELIVSADPSGWTSPNISTPFNGWLIYPITLAAGTRSILIEGLNEGSDGAFGAELYNNTAASLAAATSINDLDILFTTRERIGTFFNDLNPLLWTCAVGSLDLTIPTTPVCKLIETTTPSVKNTGYVEYAQRQKYKNGVPELDGLGDPIVEPNTTSGSGPYFPPALDLITCPI